MATTAAPVAVAARFRSVAWFWVVLVCTVVRCADVPLVCVCVCVWCALRLVSTLSNLTEGLKDRPSKIQEYQQVFQRGGVGMGAEVRFAVTPVVAPQWLGLCVCVCVCCERRHPPLTCPDGHCLCDLQNPTFLKGDSDKAFLMAGAGVFAVGMLYVGTGLFQFLTGKGTFVGPCPREC